MSVPQIPAVISGAGQVVGVADVPKYLFMIEMMPDHWRKNKEKGEFKNYYDEASVWQPTPNRPGALALLMGTFRDPDAEQEEPDVLMAYGEK